MTDGFRITPNPSTDTSLGTGPLSTGTWVLEQLECPGMDSDQDAWPEGRPELRFRDRGEVELYDGCNWMRGTYTLGEYTLTFAHRWTSTLRACEPTSSWETLWRALRSPELTWTLTSEGRLVLDPGVASGGRLAFRVREPRS